ncbi:hypothetical protein DFQ08_101558 [Winogradskyella arenosi]|uniref:Uncharacterized protein n=2 Tax=Winogradskyella arenosi TaxID=533325 RepID=A0A368ZJ08_9FLAO|nr:hypothetical protein [Winogradskyella arenosi]RCW93760.1 hypothetical protein DFQ08_101558 [Winogradskyella arenosi]
MKSLKVIYSKLRAIKDTGWNKNTAVVSLFSMLFFLGTTLATAQVKTEVDTTTIRIGEQINYKINVQADSTALVVFPEGQTFMPLENVEALKIDTTKQKAQFLLSRVYKLTQFDSGAYTIPRQKIIIGEKSFFTDSLRVNVNTVTVDTTKQKLYDIKPIIDVEEAGSDWWKGLLIIIGIVGLVAFLLYWFIWRKKPLSEEEQIALLPPYDRAKLALQKLDESQYLIRSEVKEYYSELTFIIRKYLDEKVYDRALESTTSELVARLNLLKEGNQIPLSKETILHIESILKRADLVKFAKSAPDTALAEMDKSTIDKAIDNVKVSLPEPSEEEKLLDKKYKEAQERKKKRQKIALTVGVSLFLLIATFIGFGVKYGFGYVKDTIIGHESKTLLEGQWVKSAYGFPPVYIETPKVLKRVEIELPEEVQQQMSRTTFAYGTLLDVFSVVVNTTTVNAPKQPTQGETTENPTFDLLKVSEQTIEGFEAKGAANITVKKEKFITPNKAEGLKTFGTLSLPVPNSEASVDASYMVLAFANENVLQQIVITWPLDDDYADDMIERIVNSVEVNPEEIQDNTK